MVALNARHHPEAVVPYLRQRVHNVGVVPEKKDEEKPEWIGDATGLCPECLAKQLDDPGEGR